MKYVLFSIENINNGGDEMLRVTTEHLVEMVDCYSQCVQVQTHPKKKHLPKLYLFEYYLGNAFKALSLMFSGGANFRLRNLAYVIQYYRYFYKKIEHADFVILPIGMLKYSTQNMSYVFHLINKIASALHKPVLMSAMSIEKPDAGDWRFHQLVKAVNMDCVKVLTTRDGIYGLKRLRESYIRKNSIVTDFVGDPALWIPETYNLQRKNDAQKIGVNLIRKNIYQSYKEGYVSENDMLALYKGIVEELEFRGFDWEFFCNGMDCDYAVGEELLKQLNLPKSKLAAKPTTGKELATLIAGYKCVFGARLHACITSVSLGIPIVGLLWDNKLDFFSKTMGIRDFFIDIEGLNGKNVVDKMEGAMANSFDFTNRNEYKQKTLSSVEKFINQNK